MKPVIFLTLMLGLSSPALAADCWMSVHGGGKKDGSSAENAYAAREVKAQQCWEQAGPRGTMHVLAGEYSKENDAFWQLWITASSDGPDKGENYKTLRGHGKVVLTGSRRIPYSKRNRESGEQWIEILGDAHHVKIENFRIHRVEHGIIAKRGGNHHIFLSELHFKDTRQNILLYGHENCRSLTDCPVETQHLSKHFMLKHITGMRYSKRHIRMGRGISDVTVLNSHADARYLDGDFAVGFDVENPAWNIEFRNSTSRRNRYTLSEYWNGDGFKAEDETLDIRWIGCKAWDNADAGFDIKSMNARLENIAAFRNTRNIRVWGSAVMKNIFSSNSRRHGGMGSEAGIWSTGTLQCRRCLVSNNGVLLHAENNDQDSALIRLLDSLLITGRSEEIEPLRREEGTHIELIRTEIRKAPLQAPSPKPPESLRV